MWLKDKVIYTPETIIVQKGTPVEAEIVAINVSGTEANIQLPDGSKIRVATELLEKIS